MFKEEAKKIKHNIKVTTILLAMFILTQLIGLYVVDFYLNGTTQIPYGFDNRGIEPSQGVQFDLLQSIIVSFAIAILIVFLLMRVKSVWFMRGWFFVVIALSLGITINILTQKIGLVYPSLFALVLGIFFAYLKVFRRNILIHNFTELLIYPGIAAIFVAMLNIWTTIILLIAISIYDIWAVWHSGVMQKMAKFQINSLGVFSGFFLPYASDRTKEKIRLLKLKYKDHKIPEKEIKKGKIKVALAILGGGDVIFPIIAAGVVLKAFGNIYSALCVPLFASIALLYLFVFAEKKKFYPAMPYLTAGIFIGMLCGWLIYAF